MNRTLRRPIAPAENNRTTVSLAIWLAYLLVLVSGLSGPASEASAFKPVPAPGRVTVEGDGFTRFTPAAQGRDRFLTLTPTQAARVREALVQLASQPPNHLPQ